LYKWSTYLSGKCNTPCHQHLTSTSCNSKIVSDGKIAKIWVKIETPLEIDASSNHSYGLGVGVETGQAKLNES